MRLDQLQDCTDQICTYLISSAQSHLNDVAQNKPHYILDPDLICQDLELLEDDDDITRFAVTLPSDQLTTRLKAAMNAGGEAADWLKEAFLSWYRRDVRTRLYNFHCLDASNRHLFWLMLAHRSHPNWDDDELWRLARWIEKNKSK